MNAFYEHHKDNIRFAYRCFDRILLHAAIQPFQQEQRAVGFFWTYRQIRRARPDQVVAIIKAREPATIMTAIGKDDVGISS